MKQFNLRFTVIAIISTLTLLSCHIKQAKVTIENTLVIASDYLTKGDTILFTHFSEKNKLRIVIKPMTTDAVIGLMRNKEYNSGLDLVLSASSHSTFRLWQEKLLQPIYEDDITNNDDNEYVSYKYSYVALGIDPFVIYYPSDTLLTARTYQDLFKTRHYHFLNRDDILSFLGPLRKYKDQVETFNWIERWDSVTVELASFNSDTIPAILTRYSQISKLRDSLNTNLLDDKILFPNGLRKGCYYDVLPMAIIKQAENYILAKKFIEYCTNPGHNSIINDQLNTFPLYDYLESRSIDLKLNPVGNEILLQYHPMIERILNKLK